MEVIYLILAITSSTSSNQSLYLPNSDSQQILYLKGAEGQLDYNCTDDFCELYFHVPITYGNQVPLLLTVEAPDLIDYRFIHMENKNVLCVARMKKGAGILNWISYVLVERNPWSDIPDFVAMPDPGTLPDSVTRWLESTDCCQLNSPYVAEAVQQTGAGIDNVIELAASVEDYVYEEIPWAFLHSPISFDAHYAVRWGNSCTGHAHAAAALFRGNGIPSRGLLNIPNIYGSNMFDHHWIVDYFVPDYGWVMAESGTPTVAPQGFIVTFVVEPHQEFPKWYSNAIDGLWHSSSPWIPAPDWGVAHWGFPVNQGSFDDVLAEQAMDSGAELWDLHTLYTGLILTPSEAQYRAEAVALMATAYEAILAGDIESYITNADMAISHYQAIGSCDMQEIYFEDFEGASGGWTHGGTQDSWELGTPLEGPNAAYSGANCWGTNLSGNYSDNSNCWLLSPVIDLSNRSNAELSFWFWNDIEDLNWTEHDKFFVEIHCVDTSEFTPLSDCLMGVNNDTEIVAIGGWSRVVLDLRRYITKQVQFRFTLLSDEDTTFPGAYIDNVQVSGRYKDLTGITNEENFSTLSVTCSPNPCTYSTAININLPDEGFASISVYDLSGRIVAEPAAGNTTAGSNTISWNCRNSQGSQLPSGVYIVRVNTETECTTGKLVITSP